MKKLFIYASIASMFLISACNKDNISNSHHANSPNNTIQEPTLPETGYTTYGWWKKVVGWFKKIITGGPSIEIHYKTGYYHYAGTPSNPDAYNCDPGDAVCSFDIVVTMSDETPQPDGWGNGMLGITENGKLAMGIDRSSLTDNTYNEHYADGYLSVPHDWKVQDEITQKLGLPTGFTVPQGNYKIQSVKDADAELLYVIFE